MLSKRAVTTCDPGTVPDHIALIFQRKVQRMYKLLMGGAVAFAMSSTALSAAPIQMHRGISLPSDVAAQADIWLAKGKDDKGNGKAKGHAKKVKKNHGPKHEDKGPKGKDKPKKAKANGKPEKVKADKGKGNGSANAAENNASAKLRRAFTPEERQETATRLFSTSAPSGRDMLTVLGATALGLASSQLVVADTPEDELITYANCPPGLAKKDPPCVPPGLAKKGVTFDEWASYDRDRYDEIWVERREAWNDRDVVPEPDLLLLQSDDIAELFNLGPAPSGQRYGLIDGLPVLLDDEDYTSLLLVNQMAQIDGLSDSLPIAPTAALTQEELISLYRLPQLGADQNYAVVNGQLVRMNDDEYEILQLIRVARAIL